MQDTKTASPLKQDKYWIKESGTVAHREFPSRKMFVDKIVKKSNRSLGDIKPRTFIIGVDCHWMSDNGDYTKGRFHTHELVPYKEDN